MRDPIEGLVNGNPVRHLALGYGIDMHLSRRKDINPLPVRGRSNIKRLRLQVHLLYLGPLQLSMDAVGQEQRSLFDMAAVANVKNPEWAEDTLVYEPRLINNEWITAGGKSDSVKFWRNYDVKAVMDDF